MFLAESNREAARNTGEIGPAHLTNPVADHSPPFLERGGLSHQGLRGFTARLGQKGQGFVQSRKTCGVQKLFYPLVSLGEFFSFVGRQLLPKNAEIEPGQTLVEEVMEQFAGSLAG